MSLRLFAPCAALLLIVVAGTAMAASPRDDLLRCDADPTPGNIELIDADYVLTFESLSEVGVKGKLGVKKVTLDTGAESADGIRYAYSQQGRGDASAGDLVADIETEVTSAFRQGLQRAFPDATITVEPAEVEQATLELPREGTCWGPAVDFNVEGHIALDFEDLAGSDAKEEDAQVAFRIGGRLDSKFNVTTPAGHNASYRFVLPALPPLQVERITSLSDAYAALARSMPLVLVGEPTGATKLSDTQASFTVNAWSSRDPVLTAITLPLGGKGAPHYTEQDAEVEVKVDLRDIQTSFGDLVNQKTPTIDAEVRALALINVMKVPDSFKAKLGPNLVLEYLDADGIRLLVHKKVIDQERVDRIETRLLDKLRLKVEELGGDRDSVKGGFQTGTLDWSGAFASKGLVFSASSSFLITPGQKASPSPSAPTAGLSLYSLKQSIKPTIIEGYPTDYVVYLPKHIELAEVSYSAGAVEVLPSSGDQEGFRVHVEEDGGVVTMALGVTPSFLWAKFPGLVLGIFAVLALILLGIALLVRKIVKRKK